MAKFSPCRPLAARIVLTGAMVVVTAAAWASAASAQSAFDRSRNVGVLDRPHPEYDALGLHIGQFLAFPKLEAGVENNDNIYAAATGEVGDTIYSVAPSISIESQWPRHELRVSASADAQRYSDFKNEDNTSYRAGAAGRLDVQRDSNVSGTVDFARSFEPRGSSSYVVPTRAPIEYDDSSASLRGVKEFNRLRVSGSASVHKVDYKDGETLTGIIIDQDFRDSTDSTVTGRADYAISPATAVFGEVAGTKVEYDAAPGARNRDSSGVRGLAGVNFELTDLVTGELSAGYLTRSFDDGVTDDVSEAAYRGNVNWYVTPLMTVSANAEKQIRDSAVIGSPAYVSDTSGVRVDYEARRNLIVSGTASYSRDAYQNLDREDKRAGVGVTVTYLLNRNLGVSLAVKQFTQDSFGAARTVDYKYRTAGLSLVAQF
jgi:hypothetical protein